MRVGRVEGGWRKSGGSGGGRVGGLKSVGKKINVSSCLPHCTLHTRTHVHTNTLTGIGILDRSLPMQFFMMDHRLRRCSGLGGMVVRLLATVGSHFSKKLGIGP